MTRACCRECAAGGLLWVGRVAWWSMATRGATLEEGLSLANLIPASRTLATEVNERGTELLPVDATFLNQRQQHVVGADREQGHQFFLGHALGAGFDPMRDRVLERSLAGEV